MYCIVFSFPDTLTGSFALPIPTSTLGRLPCLKYLTSLQQSSPASAVAAQYAGKPRTPLLKRMWNFKFCRGKFHLAARIQWFFLLRLQQSARDTTCGWLATCSHMTETYLSQKCTVKSNMKRKRKCQHKILVLTPPSLLLYGPWHRGYLKWYKSPYKQLLLLQLSPGLVLHKEDRPL